MALSNAERQARLHKRRMEKLAECVTPADVRRAIEVMFAWQAQEGGLDLTWSDWVQHCQTRRGREQWLGMAPESGDPEDYPNDMTDEDRALLARVGAVLNAAMKPPSSY